MATRKYEATGPEVAFEPGSQGRVLRNLLGITRVRDMNEAESQALELAQDAALDRFGPDHRFTAAQALRGQQNNLRALRQPDDGALGTRQSRQLAFLLIRQFNRRGNSQLLAPMQTEVEHWWQGMHLRSIKSQTLHWQRGGGPHFGLGLGVALGMRWLAAPVLGGRTVVDGLPGLPGLPMNDFAIRIFP